jgi:hypothetical protein
VKKQTVVAVNHVSRIESGIRDRHLRRIAHQHQRKTVPLTAVANELRGQFFGVVQPAFVAGPVVHRVGDVQNQQVMRPSARAQNSAQRGKQRKHRVGQGHRQQHQNRHADQQQDQLLDANPPGILADRGQQEFHRRPSRLAILPPTEQMDNNRQTRCQPPQQHGGIGERQR